MKTALQTWKFHNTQIMVTEEALCSPRINRLCYGENGKNISEMLANAQVHTFLENTLILIGRTEALRGNVVISLAETSHDKNDFTYAEINNRGYLSPLLPVHSHATSTITIVAKKAEGNTYQLTHCYAGKYRPTELADPTLTKAEFDDSFMFWSRHGYPYESMKNTTTKIGEFDETIQSWDMFLEKHCPIMKNL